MWKKPTLQKPDFMKVNLDEISEKESLETNGGLTTIINKPISQIIRTSGLVADPYPILSDISDIFKK